MYAKAPPSRGNHQWTRTTSLRLSSINLDLSEPVPRINPAQPHIVHLSSVKAPIKLHAELPRGMEFIPIVGIANTLLEESQNMAADLENRRYIRWDAEG